MTLSGSRRTGGLEETTTRRRSIGSAMMLPWVCSYPAWRRRLRMGRRWWGIAPAEITALKAGGFFLSGIADATCIVCAGLPSVGSRATP